MDPRDCQTFNPDPANLYPPGTLPEDRRHDQSVLCSLQLTQQLMSGVIREILLQCFADTNNLENPLLREYLQREGIQQDNQPRGLVIDTLDRWRPEETEARPALLITEHDWNWSRVGVGNRAGVELDTGRESFYGQWVGAHTVFAVGKEGAETRNWRDAAANFLVKFFAVIRDSLDLVRLEPVSLGKLQAVKGSREHYAAAYTMAYTVDASWDITPEAPRLKEIRLSNLLK
jgi:hypothetical protein